MNRRTASETTIRRKARQAGYLLRKSRRQIDANNLGGFMLIDFDNRIIAGEKFDLTLEAVKEFIESLPRSS